MKFEFWDSLSPTVQNVISFIAYTVIFDNSGTLDDMIKKKVIKCSWGVPSSYRAISSEYTVIFPSENFPNKYISKFDNLYIIQMNKEINLNCRTL